MVKISAIILNWNQEVLTLNTLSSLLKINTKNFDFDIYLVDNASRPEIRQSLKAFSCLYPQIHFIQTGSNLGYAGGNNFGIKQALKNSADYILIANNDIIFDKDFLIHLYQASLQHPSAGMLAPKIYFAPGYEFHRNRYHKNEQGNVIWSVGGKMDWKNILGSNLGVDEVDTGQYNSLSQPDFISGCCFLSPASLFKEIGVFNEKYFMYLEDVELSLRAKTKGYQLLYVPDSKIWHVNSGSSASGSGLHDYYITRNRLLFGLKYSSLKTRLALIRESIKFLFTGRPGQKQGVLDYYLARLGKGTWQ